MIMPRDLYELATQLREAAKEWPGFFVMAQLTQAVAEAREPLDQQVADLLAEVWQRSPEAARLLQRVAKKKGGFTPAEEEEAPPEDEEAPADGEGGEAAPKEKKPASKMSSQDVEELSKQLARQVVLELNKAPANPARTPNGNGNDLREMSRNQAHPSY